MVKLAGVGVVAAAAAAAHIGAGGADDVVGASPADQVSTVDREGRHTLAATCRDLAGNETTAIRSPRDRLDVPDREDHVSDERKLPARRRRHRRVHPARRAVRVAAGTGLVADGASLVSSTPGRHQFVVTARDHAGNARTLAVTYHVAARPTCAGRPATIVGTPGNDVITGTLGDDVIVTGAGRDVASGGVGDDTITGRANDDILLGGLGADTLKGNAGADNLIGHDGDDHLNGGPGSDTCRRGAHTDQHTACEFALGVP